MKSEDEWKPAAGANAPAAGFLYDRRQSRAVVILRFQNFSQNRLFKTRFLSLLVMRGFFTTTKIFSYKRRKSCAIKGAEKIF